MASVGSISVTQAQVLLSTLPSRDDRAKLQQSIDAAVTTGSRVEVGWLTRGAPSDAQIRNAAANGTDSFTSATSPGGNEAWVASRPKLATLTASQLDLLIDDVRKRLPTEPSPQTQAHMNLLLSGALIRRVEKQFSLQMLTASYSALKAAVNLAPYDEKVVAGFGLAMVSANKAGFFMQMGFEFGNKVKITDETKAFLKLAKDFPKNATIQLSAIAVGSKTASLDGISASEVAAAKSGMSELENAVGEAAANAPKQ